MANQNGYSRKANQSSLLNQPKQSDGTPVSMFDYTTFHRLWDSALF